MKGTVLVECYSAVVRARARTYNTGNLRNVNLPKCRLANNLRNECQLAKNADFQHASFQRMPTCNMATCKRCRLALLELQVPHRVRPWSEQDVYSASTATVPATGSHVNMFFLGEWVGACMVKFLHTFFSRCIPAQVIISIIHTDYYIS